MIRPIRSIYSPRLLCFETALRPYSIADPSIVYSELSHGLRSPICFRMYLQPPFCLAQSIHHRPGEASAHNASSLCRPLFGTSKLATPEAGRSLTSGGNRNFFWAYHLNEPNVGKARLRRPTPNSQRNRSLWNVRSRARLPWIYSSLDGVAPSGAVLPSPRHMKGRLCEP